jgi:anti-anti-sigma factor
MRAKPASAVTLQRSEYDIYNVTEFEKELADVVAPACVVDFRNVTFIDLTCVAVLIRTYKRLRIADRNSHITLTNVSAPLKRLFTLTKLECVFHIE